MLCVMTSRTSRPEDFESWRYELVLAIDDPDVSDGTGVAAAAAAAGEGGKATAAPTPATPRFAQGSPPPASDPWRCAACYHKRFTTMCFGMNKPGTANCKPAVWELLLLVRVLLTSTLLYGCTAWLLYCMVVLHGCATVCPSSCMSVTFRPPVLRAVPLVVSRTLCVRADLSTTACSITHRCLFERVAITR